jgi:hypothetical protein
VYRCKYMYMYTIRLDTRATDNINLDEIIFEWGLFVIWKWVPRKSNFKRGEVEICSTFPFEWWTNSDLVNRKMVLLQSLISALHAENAWHHKKLCHDKQVCSFKSSVLFLVVPWLFWLDSVWYIEQFKVKSILHGISAFWLICHIIWILACIILNILWNLFHCQFTHLVKIFTNKEIGLVWYLTTVCISWQTTVPPTGLTSLTEDSLLRHAQFVVDQVSIQN